MSFLPFDLPNGPPVRGYAAHLLVGRAVGHPVDGARASRGYRTGSAQPRTNGIHRFITPKRAEDMPGMWQRYYTRWRDATRERLDPALLELLPPLASLCRAPLLNFVVLLLV
jgi:hypothetical protein